MAKYQIKKESPADAKEYRVLKINLKNILAKKELVMPTKKKHH